METDKSITKVYNGFIYKSKMRIKAGSMKSKYISERNDIEKRQNKSFTINSDVNRCVNANSLFDPPKLHFSPTHNEFKNKLDNLFETIF